MEKEVKQSKINVRVSNKPKVKHEVITILSWNPRFTSRKWWYKQKEFNTCHKMKRRCSYTLDRGKYNQSDIILMDTFYMRPKAFPKYRFPFQKWLFHGYESPARKQWPKYGRYDGWFNISMSFSLKSDVYEPYGICFDSLSDWSKQNAYVKKLYGKFIPHKVINKQLKISRKSTGKRKTSIAGKSSNVIWIASHCDTNSKREKYVEALSKLIDVDIYGKCGDKSLSMEDEILFLNRDYRFYLSFENSFCEEYVTEKLFKVLKNNVIPVVLGNANYASFLPPKSFIDVRDFKSVKKLAQYLRLLASNEDLYSVYFEWKTRYVCFSSLPSTSQACRLCEMLNSKYDTIQRIESITKFWSKENDCLTQQKFYKNIKLTNL